jgi:CRP/FNR family transcriptional regulator
MHLPQADALVRELRAQYPSLGGLSADRWTVDFDRDVRVLDVPPGTRLFEAGMPCAGFPLVLAGEIRVARGSHDGRSLELYRVVAGEVCIVSAAGLLSHRPLTAQGTATLNTRLVLLSPSLFNRWNDHPPFREFIFGVFADRLADLMAVVDAVAFQRLDRRLANYLLGHGRYVRTTHQAVADELGTVREMITRLLNRFEAAGAVKLGRERIEVLDPAGLRAIASGQDATD